MKPHIKHDVVPIKENYSISVEDITPDKAKELLKLNTANFRPLDKIRVEHYAQEIRKGNWELNGSSIVIKDNKIIDGQHRLEAIIKAGRLITTIIAYDLPGGAFGLDRGKTKTIGNFLKHEGFKSANHVASATKLVLQYDRGKWDLSGLGIGAYADSDILEYASRNQVSMENAIRFASRNSGPMNLSHSLIAAVAHITSGRISDPEADEFVKWFWRSFNSGTNVDADEPVLLLRNRLIKAKTSPQDSLTPLYQRALITLAWNKTIRGEKAKTLSIRLAGPGKQSIPKVLLATTDYE